MRSDERSNPLEEVRLWRTADEIIRIADIVGKIGCCPKLVQAIEIKMAYNKTRPFMHGGKTC